MAEPPSQRGTEPPNVDAASEAPARRAGADGCGPHRLLLTGWLMPKGQVPPRDPGPRRDPGNPIRCDMLGNRSCERPVYIHR